MSNVCNERPTHRRLRGYAFDPMLSLDRDTADINNIVYKIRWEEGSEFGPGPVGEYLEVVDYDPTIKQYYEPVDLGDHYILANDGLRPSESNPQFHQQMVYAVAMLTIQHFEHALGRKILWAPRLTSGKDYEVYVQRLRIYPHALREANAYYSPLKKALLFGYFLASPATAAAQMPGSLVFTCLSHDIVAHEVTHAILDGLHCNYNAPTNPDVLAFHEAFSDIVALFQHFTFPEVLKHQIARTRGNLDQQNLLGELAQQFGTAIGHYGSLRSALGSLDPKTKKWKQAKPDPAEYHTIMEPHERGSILVATVFEAFLSIYKGRIKDLLRIATGGTGILPRGELHPDLVNRLAEEASRTAGHVLTMCIRAIDYCPPVDITFGDFLRAIITADHDLVDDDPHQYRLAFIQAFRRRGIYPRGIRTLNEESLRYRDLSDQLHAATDQYLATITAFLRKYRRKLMYETKRDRIYQLSKDCIEGEAGSQGLHRQLSLKFGNSFDFEKLTGLVFNKNWKKFGIRTASSRKGPSFQVLNLRLVSRIGPDGNQLNQIVFGLIQRMGVICKNGQPLGHYIPNRKKQPPPGGFEVQGGCTLIFDLDSLDLKYAIAKPLLLPDALDQSTHEVNQEWIESQRNFQRDVLPLCLSEIGQYFGTGYQNHFGEPFSMLHRHAEGEPHAQ